MGLARVGFVDYGVGFVDYGLARVGFVDYGVVMLALQKSKLVRHG